MTTPRSEEGRHFGFASALFVFSGLTGLAYEIIWFKRFSVVWGNSALAQAAVVASFLLGIGLGARWLGSLADRVRNPLRWYGLAEAAIGILGLLIPLEIARLLQFAPALDSRLADQPLALSLVRCGLTFLVIGPPCILMGGTLPLLIRQFAKPAIHVSNSTGWFYAINTLGAAAGCSLTGFVVLPRIGLFWSNALAAGLNLAIGIAAVILSKTSPSSEAPRSRPDAADENKSGAICLPSEMVYLAAAITGGAALMLQVVWTRQLALILGGSTYAFSAMLCVFLAGIGIGSLLFQRWLQKFEDGLTVTALVLLVIALGVWIGQWLIWHLTIASGLVAPLRSSPLVNDLFCLGVSLVIELIPTIGMGALLPLLVQFAPPHKNGVGSRVGTVYAVNTSGSILGAVLTPLVLVPGLGVSMTTLIAVAFYLAVALLILLQRPKRDVFLLSYGIVCVLLLVLLAATSISPLIGSYGMYLYGFQPAAQAGAKMAFFKEGVTCNVLVVKKDGHTSLRVNGKVDASNSGDMETQLGLAYFPRFLRPTAQKVLVIGFGSGSTSGASLLFPNTQVTCCDIEPAVFEASACFADVNHSPERSGKFSIVFDDARAFLQRTTQRYDLIVSEPSNPWISGVSNLFTSEYFRMARQRLNPQGVLAQWIQGYSLSAADFALVVRTAMREFPQARLYWINEYDTLLMASDSPIELTRENLRAAQALVDGSSPIQQDLKKYFGTVDVTTLLLTHHILDEAGLQKLVQWDGSRAINTDDNLRLEFNAPRRMFGGGDTSGIVQLILNSVNSKWYPAAFAEIVLPEKQVNAFRVLSAIFSRNEHPELALEVIQAGLALVADHPKLLSEQLLLSGGHDVEATRAAVSRILKLSEREAGRVGVDLWKRKKYHEALVVFEEMAGKQPKSASLCFNLAVNYKESGQPKKAREACRKGLALDPLNGNLLELVQSLEEDVP